jgi:SAM-dependent methyltransferase
MMEHGLDWKQSVREAARVLKPGGRLLFVEPTLLKGESYLEYVQTLTEDDMKQRNNVVQHSTDDDDDAATATMEEPASSETTLTTTTINEADTTTSDTTTPQVSSLVFDDVGFDDIDLVLIPHIAGVAIKSMGPPPSAQEVAAQEAQAERERLAAEQDRLAELSLQAYERGLKKRKKRKGKGDGSDATTATAAAAAAKSATSSNRKST